MPSIKSAGTARFVPAVTSKRKAPFRPTVSATADTAPTDTHKAIARALELDCTPERAHLWRTLEHLLRTQLYRGSSFARLSGGKFAIAARRAYWVHLNHLDDATYAATFAAGQLP